MNPSNDPLDDYSIAELRAIGRNPENFLYEISYAHEIQKLTDREDSAVG